LFNTIESISRGPPTKPTSNRILKKL